MSHYSFDHVVNRKQTQSVKWDKTDTFFGSSDVLPLWVADMDFLAPPDVLNALQERVNHGVFGYSATSSETSSALTQWLQRKHQWSVNEDSIVYSPGIVFAISMAIQAFTKQGDHILIQSPVYTPFFEMVKLNDRQVVENPLHLKDDRYEIDFTDLEEKLANDIKLMILCSPHNPVGRVWTREELTKIAALCIKYNVLLLSDEIHSDLIYQSHKHIPISSLDDQIAKQTITCVAPSKTFNIPGLQASAIIIPNEQLREAYNKQQQKQGFFTLNTFGIIAIEAAYRKGDAWLNDLLLYLEENVKLVESFIQSKLPDLRVIKPEGTYLMWIDFRNLNMTDEQFNHLLLHKGKVAVEPGTKYGENGSGFVRLNIACPRSTLLEGLERIERALST
ncbi:MalY/PatB family protein [Metabacillus iocasae]|uniref:cysteine-S-conjugate beta-lyase n=1 Tax=Priestia iocasae TaxID=2291674 RepID=A0ABS2QZG1_9BACI|nr:MalY/PatB family protein [Metabacillus iocasae]MBM7704633.1 cystathionine beta-lyase [Metabacillus iocasae]